MSAIVADTLVYYNVGCILPFEHVRMAEWSKALRSGRSPLLWAWVRIPLLTKSFFCQSLYWILLLSFNHSRVAQWKRAGPITQRSVDRNYALLIKILPFALLKSFLDHLIFLDQIVCLGSSYSPSTIAEWRSGSVLGP